MFVLHVHLEVLSLNYFVIELSFMKIVHTQKLGHQFEIHVHHIISV